MPGLRVIDGTPTAISKFIREEEARVAENVCPLCGNAISETSLIAKILKKCPFCGGLLGQEKKVD